MRFLTARLLGALAFAAGVGFAVPAAAGGDFFFSFGVGVPAYHHHGHRWRGHHYRPHHYRHHRHHYRPRYRSTVIFAPPPVYYVQPPPPPPRETCARFNGNATVDGRGTPFHGVACLRADGRWHIVSGG